MKKPDGGLDIIGTVGLGIEFGRDIAGLIRDFKRSPEELKAARLKKRLKIARRQLTHRFKDDPIEPYVNLNFMDLTVEERAQIIGDLQELLGRK